MHNGQIGGFEVVRKSADMLIPDALYRHRRGATDSEAFFLVALGNGMATDTLGAKAAPSQLLRRWRPRPRNSA